MRAVLIIMGISSKCFLAISECIIYATNWQQSMEIFYSHQSRVFTPHNFIWIQRKNFFVMTFAVGFQIIW